MASVGAVGDFAVGSAPITRSGAIAVALGADTVSYTVSFQSVVFEILDVLEADTVEYFASCIDVTYTLLSDGWIPYEGVSNTWVKEDPV